MRASVKAWVGVLSLLAALVAVVPASAQETPEKYLELLRSDVRATKVEILTEALGLTAAQGEAFWPIYREYDTALTALGDKRIASIKDFVASYGSIDDTKADKFANDWFAFQNDRMKLLKDTYKKAAKATSPIIAARFVQTENVIGKLIDLQIAAELPLME